MDLKIRLATADDAPNMANIHARSLETAYKGIIPEEYIKQQSSKRLALWENIMSKENSIHYVISCDNMPVGMMTVGDVQRENIEVKDDLGIDESFYELHGIYLHPDYYRKGIGTAAMAFAFGKAIAANKTNILLWVFEENVSSIKFYEKCGFTADGASKIYNCGKEMKCIRMQKSLR